MATAAISGPGSGRAAAARSQARTTGRHTTATRMTRARPPSRRPTPVAARCPAAMADTTASSSQPRVSSTDTEHRMSWPMSRCSRRRSVSVLAMTGIALTPTATPTNSANVVREAWAGIRLAGSSKARPVPAASGTTSPAMPVLTAGPARRRIRPRSSWMPVMPTSSSRPIWATASSRWICPALCGSSQALTEGARWASTDGPASTPAHSSPTMAGIPSRMASRPSRNARSSSNPTSASRTTS